MYDKKTLMRYGRIKWIDWIALIFGILLSSIGFLAVCSEFLDTIFRSQNEGSLNEVKATVVDFVESPSTDDDGDTTYNYYPVMEYEVEGITYVKAFARAHVNSFGAQVELLYSPANPQSAVLSNSTINFTTLIGGLIFFTIGIKVLIAFISFIRKRNIAKKILLDFKESGDERAFGKSTARLYQYNQSTFPFLPVAFGAVFVIAGLSIPFRINSDESELKHANKTFIPVTATVIDNVNYSTRADSGYDTSRIFHSQMAEYEANGRTYVRVLNSNKDYSVGSDVALQYDPNNHGYTTFANIDNGNAALFASLFLIPFALIGLVPIVSGIKQWRKNRNQIN